MKNRIKKMTMCGMVIFVVLFGLWAHFDSHAIPQIVDFARSIIGDANMLKLETAYYTAQNSWAEKSYTQANAAKIESARLPHIVVIVKKQKNWPEELNQGELGGKWTNKGNYFLTSICPEEKLGSTADIVFINKTKVDLRLVCGTADPASGGSGKILPTDLAKVFMAFSGGFQYRHDRCGIAIDGKVLRPMKNRAGTVLIGDDGKVKIGRWGTDFKIVPPQTKYARQCLYLVAHGQFNAEEPYDCYALGNKFYVFRSALGVTKNGNLVYAAGNALSAKGLAKAMIAAGAVNAICLDMNYGNATCGVIRNDRILPLTKRFPNPNRFLGMNARDFFYLIKK